MSTASYITLNGKRYVTFYGNWKERFRKNANVRQTVDGTLDITYGPKTYREWIGAIRAPITVTDTAYGTYADLRAAVDLRQGMPFRTHNPGEPELTVHIVGEIEADTATPDFFGSENFLMVSLILIVE